MGCGSSVPKHSVVDTSGWVHVEIDPKTGTVKGEKGEDLCACTIGKKPDGTELKDSPVSMHFVQEKCSVTWTESKLGGELTYTVLSKAEFKELFDKCGAKGQVDSPEDIEERTTSKVVEKPVAAGWACVCGKAVWGDTLYLFTGEINDRVNVINHKTGIVVLSMSQWNMGSQLKYYTSNVNREDRASVRKDKQQARADEAYCGTRDREARETVRLDIKPAIYEKIPLSLFAAAYFYSSFDHNGCEC